MSVRHRALHAFNVSLGSISATALLLFLISGCNYSGDSDRSISGDSDRSISRAPRVHQPSVPQNVESIYVLRDPRDPLGQLTYEDGDQIAAQNVTVISDTLLGLGTWNKDVFFIDVSEPETPKIVSAFRTRGLSPGIVAVMDGFAYTLDSLGIEVVDISDPARPQSANFISRTVDDLAGEGGYLYMAHRAGNPYIPIGIEIWDATNPPTLTLASIYAPPQYRASRASVPEYLRATPRQQEAERSVYSGPFDMGEMPGIHSCDPGLIISADIENGLLYIYVTTMGCWNREKDRRQPVLGGLWILDVKNPGEPLPIGFLPAAFASLWSWEIKVVGNYAYLATSLGGLFIADVSDSAQPSYVSQYATGELVMDVDVKGNIVYIGDLFHLHVLDVSNPAEPERIGFMPRFFDIDDITVHADLIYLAAVHKGFPSDTDPDPLSHVQQGVHVLRLIDNGVRKLDLQAGGEEN